MFLERKSESRGILAGGEKVLLFSTFYNRLPLIREGAGYNWRGWYKRMVLLFRAILLVPPRFCFLKKRRLLFVARAATFWKIPESIERGRGKAKKKGKRRRKKVPRKKKFGVVTTTTPIEMVRGK